MDQHVMKVTSVLLVPHRQFWCFLISPGGRTSGYLTLHTEVLRSPH